MKYVFVRAGGDRHVMLNVTGLIKEVNRAAGTAALLAVKENFISLGGKRYYGRAARTTQVTEATEDGVTVEVMQRGIALHYFGGTVRPTGEISEVTGKPTKALLIPGPRSPQRLRDKSLHELGYPPDRVHVIKSKNGKAYLVADAKPRVKLGKGEKAKKLKGKDKYIYLGALRKTATIKANPAVLPSDATWTASLGEAVENVLLAHEYIK